MIDYALAFCLIMLGAGLALLIFYIGFYLGKYGDLEKKTVKRKRKDVE